MQSSDALRKLEHNDLLIQVSFSLTTKRMVFSFSDKINVEILEHFYYKSLSFVQVYKGKGFKV